jgi:transposase
MVTMSQKEFQRVKVIENAVGGRLSVGEAARLLQLSARQVQRLKRRYQPDSLAWVQHGNRGQRMPWAVSLPQKQLILRLARGKYQGFNDSHLTEKLRAEQNLTLAKRCGVFCALPNWLLRRNAALANIAVVEFPARASA